jgi:hypothetical protein
LSLSLIINGLNNKPLHPTDFLRTHSHTFLYLLKKSAEIHFQHLSPWKSIFHP